MNEHSPFMHAVENTLLILKTSGTISPILSRAFLENNALFCHYNFSNHVKTLGNTRTLCSNVISEMHKFMYAILHFPW